MGAVSLTDPDDLPEISELVINWDEAVALAESGNERSIDEQAEETQAAQVSAILAHFG